MRVQQTSKELIVQMKISSSFYEEKKTQLMLQETNVKINKKKVQRKLEGTPG